MLPIEPKTVGQIIHRASNASQSKKDSTSIINRVENYMKTEPFKFFTALVFTTSVVRYIECETGYETCRNNPNPITFGLPIALCIGAGISALNRLEKIPRVRNVLDKVLGPKIGD